jgi:histidine ammonia-lyase
MWQLLSNQERLFTVSIQDLARCVPIINPKDTHRLQENILKSHAVGVGEPIEESLSKLMLILKVHALSKGFSGVQLSTIERIIWHIENDVIPVVPKQGSVGASGDLAPLSHLFLPLIGLGKVFFNGKIQDTPQSFNYLA